jgi:penicillin-binding protein 1A
VPIFTEFMTAALKDQPAEDFKPPTSAKFAMVNGIREAFRPGTEPVMPAMPLGTAGAAGPIPYEKAFGNLLPTPGQPPAGQPAPGQPAPPPKKQDDVRGLY